MSKEKERPDRFALPKGSLIAPAVGAPRLGLPDKPLLRARQYEYEAEMAQRNEQQATTGPANGLRFAAGNDYMNRLDEHKRTYDDWKRPNKPAFKETLTSVDNPLRTAANDASGLPFYTQRGIKAAQVEEVQAPKGKRCFMRNERYGMMEQLASGSLVPLVVSEMKDARLTARRAVKAAETLRHRPGGDAEGDASDADMYEQDMEVWTEEGVEQDAMAAGRQQRTTRHTDDGDQDGKKVDDDDHDPSAFPTKDQDKVVEARKLVMEKAAQELAIMQELEEQLIREYPHGAPKYVIMKLAKQKGLTHLNVPSLGFGFSTCLSSKMAAATLRGN